MIFSVGPCEFGLLQRRPYITRHPSLQHSVFSNTGFTTSRSTSLNIVHSPLDATMGVEGIDMEDTEPKTFSVPVDSGNLRLPQQQRPHVCMRSTCTSCSTVTELIEILTIRTDAEHKSKVLRLYSFAWPHHRHVSPSYRKRVEWFLRDCLSLTKLSPS